MARWNRTGSATVTNGQTAVVGTLTAWQTSARAGDRITFNANAAASKWYEVASVESNTALTLGNAYAGASGTISGTSGDFAIDNCSPDWSKPGDVALSVSRLLERITLIPQSGGVGDALKIPRINSSGTAYELVAASSSRETLTVGRTYFVNTIGSDANSGLTAATPFRTIQKAVDAVAALDTSIFAAQITVADGTYDEAITLKDPAGSGACYLLGNSAVPANVVINATGFSGAVYSSDSRKWSIGGFTLYGGASVIGINASGSAAVITVIAPIAFGGSAPSYIHLFASNRGVVRVNANYTISVAATYHVLSTTGGSISINNTSIVLSAVYAFSMFAYVTDMSYFTIYNPVFTGSSTGTKYYASNLSLISTGGAGVSYLPGNAGGSVSSGAIYG